MLVDNAVELLLHQHADDRHYEEQHRRRQQGSPKSVNKALTAALGTYFDDKVKYAASSGLLALDAAESVRNLHAFRNAVYHRGLQHEGILHSIALFYFLRQTGNRGRPRQCDGRACAATRKATPPRNETSQRSWGRDAGRAVGAG